MRCIPKDIYNNCKRCGDKVQSYSQICRFTPDTLPDFLPEPKEAVGLKIKVNPNPPTKEQAESDARYCAEQKFKYNF